MGHNVAAELAEALDEPFRPGNTVSLLQNGEEIFPAMLAAIRSAERTIEFATYVYWKSDIADQFAQALIERAKAGVTVRMLIDAVGGAVMSSRTVWQLEQAGVKMAWFRPLWLRHLHQMNRRTHRKILIIDGSRAFTGGVGIADQWRGGGRAANEWREIHCEITGPACIDIYESFAQNWTEAARGRLPHRSTPEASGNIAVLTTSSTPRRGSTAGTRLVHAAIAAAREQLWIASAYFVPDPALIAQIAAAAERGVDVRVLTNGAKTNHYFTWQAGRTTYAPLLVSGVKIYEFMPTVLHSKLITVDRQWASLGSINLDPRSLVINDELNVSFADTALVARLDASFQADLVDSQLVDAKTWSTNATRNNLVERISRVFASQL